MKTLNNQVNKQQGVASLLTALIILVSITLVVLLTSKTVLMETKMTADNHRISQAVGSANYAIDLGYNYYDQGGFDQDVDTNIDTQADIDGDGAADLFNALTLTSAPFTGLTASFTDVTQATSGSFLFNNLPADNANGSRCVSAGSVATMVRGLISGTGLSDDGLATRTVTQCVGPLAVLSNDGPDQPLVSRGSVLLTGNATIINRYTNTTIWSGDVADIVNSVSVATYIGDSPPSTLTDAELISPSTTVTVQYPDGGNVELVSNKNLGNGLDIIDDDPSLAALSGEEFFTNFFSVSSYIELRNLAIENGQYYLAANVSEIEGKSGIIWVEGDTTINANWLVGSATSPVILIINGDLQVGGGPTIHGLVYVIGRYVVNGTITIIGSSIVEGTDNINTGAPSAPPIVSGNGTMNLVYWSDFLSNPNVTPPGLGAVVDGSWKDW